jgi:hypothetical protein
MAVALALLIAPVLGACGDSHTPVHSGTYAGESGANAPYLNVGPLVYEVQLSRQLNSWDLEDSYYLQGVSAAERTLKPGQEWFAVFVQVYNETSAPHPLSTKVTITDTQGNVYTPLTLASTNNFAYRPGLIDAKSQVPAPNSVAASASTQGALLLFKLRTESLDNRPLDLKIVDPRDALHRASAELDV